MAVPFSRTLRTAEAEARRDTAWMLLLMFSLPALWSVWLFCAEISWYESASARLDRTEGSLRAVAFFDRGALLYPIRTGQKALFRIEGPRPIGADTDVASIAPTLGAPQDRIESGPIEGASLSDGARGTIAVEVARLSPARLLFRWLGGPAT